MYKANFTQLVFLMASNSFQKSEIAVETAKIAEKTANPSYKLSTHTIQRYMDQGLVVPEVKDVRGKGTTRLCSKRNIVEMLMIKRCVQAGVRLERLSYIMKWMNKRYPVGNDHPLDPEIERNLKVHRILVIRNVDQSEGDAFFEIKFVDKFEISMGKDKTGKKVENAFILDVTNIVRQVSKI